MARKTRPILRRPRAFSRSCSPPDQQIRQGFDALGWTIPADQAARRHAVDGTVEVRPAKVLVAALAVTKFLYPPPPEKKEKISGVITKIEVTDGAPAVPQLKAVLDTEALRVLMTPAARIYMQNVLRAPIQTGTMRALNQFFMHNHIEEFWSKSGTADSSARSTDAAAPTRALWHVGGFLLADRPYAYLLVVTSRNAMRPLGHVQSPTLVPLTAALLKHALEYLEH